MQLLKKGLSRKQWKTYSIQIKVLLTYLLLPLRVFLKWFFLSLELTDVVSVIKCIEDIGWEGSKIVGPRSGRIFTCHFVRESLWKRVPEAFEIHACNLAAKQFWPISSISYPGLMQDHQQSKKCAVKCGKDGSLPSIHHRSKGSGVMDNHCQFLTEKLTHWHLFQLKILRTGSLLCSWTNGIISLIVYLQRWNAPSPPIKCPVFNWNKGLFFYKQRSDISHEKEQAR